MEMVKVSVADIQKLREITGAGMMDCKKALEEAGGDFEGAQDWLRKKGIAKAAKREDREAKEGVVIAIANADQTRGVIVALNCETDFVARNDNFVELTGKMADLALSNFPDSLEALLSLPFEGSVSIAEKVGEQNGVIGEKIELSRYERIEGAQVLTYNHSNNKRSVLVALNKAGHDDAGRNVAMQIAAMSPVSVGKDDVDPKIIEKEIEIGKELARNEGKHARKDIPRPPQQVFPGEHPAQPEIRKRRRRNGRTIPQRSRKRPYGNRLQARRAVSFTFPHHCDISRITPRRVIRDFFCPCFQSSLRMTCVITPPKRRVDLCRIV